jgi:hypothetical protein
MELLITVGNLDDSSGVFKELRQSLLAGSIPKSAIKTLRSSEESMDIGSILSIDWGTLYAFMQDAANLAAFGKLLYDLVGKQKSTIELTIGKSKEVIHKGMTEEQIQKALKRLSES